MRMNPGVFGASDEATGEASQLPVIVAPVHSPYGRASSSVWLTI